MHCKNNCLRVSTIVQDARCRLLLFYCTPLCCYPKCYNNKGVTKGRKTCYSSDEYEVLQQIIYPKTNIQMAVDPLDMLAEVASNTLHQSRSLATPARLQLKESKRAWNRTRQLLKLFSKFDGDEMRRKFTFSCLFDVGQCNATFSSFGSELKARQSMKSHLFDHVQQIGGTSDSVCKQRKMLANRKSVRKKDKITISSFQPDLIQKQTINKNSCDKTQSNIKIKLDHISSKAKSTFKLYKRNSKHFCGKSKFEKPCPKVCGAHFDHNYTVRKTIPDVISSDLPRNSKGDQRLLEIVDVDENDRALSSLNSFMVQEVDYFNVLVTCLENDCSLQLTGLPPVGEEVSVVTTISPGVRKNQDISSPLDSVVPYDGASKICLDVTECILDASSAPVNNAEKYCVTSDADIETKLTDKEMAIKLIAEAKNKGSSHPLHCTICTPHRQFTALTTLVGHYRSHAGIKPFECLVCHRSFTRQHSLNYHLLIHQNATRFTCAHCARKFRHPSHYREHLRKHTGEEPFHCCDCTARFKTRNTFKRHLRSRHSKVLTASGEVFQADEAISRPVERLPISARPETSPAESLGSKDVDKENSVGSFSEKNGRQSKCDPSEILVGVIMEEINQDESFRGGTQGDLSNNNATNQSAFFAADKDVSNSSIRLLPNSSIVCKM